MPTAEEKQRARQDRPGAGGHRFGPRLRCGECGISWEAHQQDPKPCVAQCETVAKPIANAVEPEAAKLEAAEATKPEPEPAEPPKLEGTKIEASELQPRGERSPE